MLLQAVYLAMVCLAGYATFLYIIHLPEFSSAVRLNSLAIVLLAAPVAIGAIVTFFLLKPLFARSPAGPQLMRLDRSQEPTLFQYVDRLCSILGAPKPTIIEVDLRVNASARLRQGWRSLHNRDLALTIGLPLVSGLTLREFSGVLAHEFGHFAQHAGMRLHFLISTIRHWFARVSYERDSWDAWLDEYRSNGGWRARLILSLAYATVSFSRMVLRGLLYVANMMSAWFSRQMEFDADRHAAEVVGGKAFADALVSLPALEASTDFVWSTLNRTWKERRLCVDFAYLFRHHDSEKRAGLVQQIREHLLEEKTDRWATHPATAVRIKEVEGVVGIAVADVADQLGDNAEVLFRDYRDLSQRATLHYLREVLGGDLASATFVPAAQYLLETRDGTLRVEALRDTFGPLTKPSRWFQLPAGPKDEGTLRVYLALEDESQKYWRLLEQSLLRYAAHQFIRAGGRIEPAAFQLSSSDEEPAEVESAASRTALNEEISRLRGLYQAHGYLLPLGREEIRAAYCAFAAEQDTLLELRHRVVALRLIQNNLGALSGNSFVSAEDAPRRQVKELCEEILGRWSRVPAPILQGHARAAANLAERMTLGCEPDAAPEVVAAQLVDRADELGEELLGELCLGFGAGHQPDQEKTEAGAGTGPSIE